MRGGRHGKYRGRWAALDAGDLEEGDVMLLGKGDEEWEEINGDLVILGMVGIKDPLRDGIAAAVKACHEGGVRVRMVTGDNKRTAIAIAKEAGILDRNWKE